MLKLKVRIRTLLVISFLVIASFTLILTLFINSAVTETNHNANEIISSSLDIMDRSQQTNALSDEVMYNLEMINQYNMEGNTSQALEYSREFNENFQEFSSVSDGLIKALDEAGVNEEIEDDLQELKNYRESIDIFLQETESSIRVGIPIQQRYVEEYREQVQSLVASSTDINSHIVERQKTELLELNREMTELSDFVVIIGVILIGVSFIFAFMTSFVISYPIKSISEEAEKIKKENLNKVNLGRINTHTKEVEDIKDVLSDIKLTLKAEFGRSSGKFSTVGDEIVKKMSDYLPRATAESTLTSACKIKGIKTDEITEDDVKEILSQLRISMRGLNVDKQVFKDIKSIIKD